MKRDWEALLPPATEHINEENLKLFFETMFERQEIWWRRFILKQPGPWTTNKILAENKFTNVYRQADRASLWLIENVITQPQKSFEDLIFKIICYRFYNLSDAFEHKGKYKIILPDYKEFNIRILWQQTVDYRENVSDPWSNAYFKNPALRKPINWNRAGIFRDEIYCEYVIPIAHKLIPSICKQIEKTKPDFNSCRKLIDVLTQIPGVALFMAHEFFQDFCYISIYSKQFKVNFDANSWSNVGPGCATGIRLVFPSLIPKEQTKGIYWLHDLSEEWLTKIGKQKQSKFKYLYWDGEKHIVKDEWNLTLHQIEMWLCETSKYWKVMIGMGKQRSKFKPKTIVR